MPRFSAVPRDVVSEIIDGEAVIMDLRSGLYFSADGLGALIWDGIAAGQDTTAIADRIGTATSAEAARIAEDLDAFVAALVEHRLVVARADTAPAADWTLPLPAAPVGYVTPRLERHGDLQDLAALDPIHDVEENVGWPVRRAEEATAAPPEDAAWPNRRTAY